MTNNDMSDNGLSAVPREARPYQGRRAGLVSRFVAAALDAVVVGTVLVTIYGAWAILLFLVEPRSFELPQAGIVFSLMTAFFVLVVYLTLCWRIGGRTYGFHVMGLRVLRYDGKNLRFAGALVRALFCAVFPIGLLWVAVNRENRSIQDVVLRTSVVYDWLPAGVTGGHPHHGPDDGHPGR